MVALFNAAPFFFLAFFRFHSVFVCLWRHVPNGLGLCIICLTLHNNYLCLSLCCSDITLHFLWYSCLYLVPTMAVFSFFQQWLSDFVNCTPCNLIFTSSVQSVLKAAVSARAWHLSLVCGIEIYVTMVSTLIVTRLAEVSALVALDGHWMHLLPNFPLSKNISRPQWMCFMFIKY